MGIKIPRKNPANIATTKPAPAQSDQTWAKEADLNQLIGSVNYFVKGATHRFENAEANIKDLKARVLVLEGKVSQESEPDPVRPSPEPAEPKSDLEPAKPKSDLEPAKPKLDPEPTSQSEEASPEKAPGRLSRAYNVWDPDTRSWYTVRDIFDAKQSDSDYEPVRVWVDNQGKIIRPLTREEIRIYCP